MGGSSSSSSPSSSSEVVCEQKVLVFGAWGSGKTTLLYRVEKDIPHLISEEVETHEEGSAVQPWLPFIGFYAEYCYWQDYYHTTKQQRQRAYRKANGHLTSVWSSQKYTSEHTYGVYSWDFREQDVIRHVYRTLFEGCRGLICVIDMVDTTQREFIKNKMKWMLTEDLLNENLQPLLIVFNKRDLFCDDSCSFDQWRWMEYLSLSPQISFDAKELRSIMMIGTFLGQCCNFEMIQVWSNLITAFCFGENHLSLYTERSRPEEVRPVKCVETQVRFQIDELEPGLEWLFRHLSA